MISISSIFQKTQGKGDLLFFQDRGEQLFDKYLNTRSQTNTPTELQELDLEKKTLVVIISPFQKLPSVVVSGSRPSKLLISCLGSEKSVSS